MIFGGKSPRVFNANYNESVIVAIALLSDDDVVSRVTDRRQCTPLGE